MLVACFQDKNGTIENEELNGFLKDLTELVQQVNKITIKIVCDDL